jgi:serine/threonine protein kinase
MAEVFLAREKGGGLVALKRILPHLAEQVEFVQMFLDEARIAAQLHHPNIVRTTDLGKLGSSIFLAMEYVHGVDLRRVLQRQAQAHPNGFIPLGVAVRIIVDATKGLVHAHECVGVDGRPLEIVHRDVSPQNVMVGFDGTVKLVDFGIARAGAFMAASKPGMIKGKFLYLSPEQIQKLKVDHRADLFAVGTLLYEATTGKSPFARPTGEAVILAIRSEEPVPPAARRAGFPPRLAAIIARCHEKDRDRRYQSAHEIIADLEDFLASTPGSDSAAVQAYLGQLFGTEEERTRMHLPSKSAPPPPPPKTFAKAVSVIPLTSLPPRLSKKAVLNAEPDSSVDTTATEDPNHTPKAAVSPAPRLPGPRGTTTASLRSPSPSPRVLPPRPTVRSRPPSEVFEGEKQNTQRSSFSFLQSRRPRWFWPVVLGAVFVACIVVIRVLRR